MKKVILLFVFLPLLAKAQVLENFETGNTGNWTQIPSGRWQADSVRALTGLYSLHHIFDNNESSADIISIPLSNLYVEEGETQWSFSIRYGYDPSASNNWAVFLLSVFDQSVPGNHNIYGFATGVNLTGYDDTLRIWKVTGDGIIEVVNSHINWQNDVGHDSTVIISVRRSTGGAWTLDINHISGNHIDSATGFDPQVFNCASFTIKYSYTSSCDRLLWLDDIYVDGVFHEDTKPPAITNCEVAGSNKLLLTLDEQPAAGFTAQENFKLNGSLESPVKIAGSGNLAWILEFENEFRNKSENHLLIGEICDNNGNCINDTIIRFDVFQAEIGDLVISEIMADPEPEISLPAAEYIELTNRSAFFVNTKYWELLSGEQVIILPEFLISPGDIVILCSVKDTAVFKDYGKVIGIKSFPVLNDKGKLLCLSDSTGHLIHGVEYSDNWYGDELKSSGGWSLEMIDTDYPFFWEGNWKAGTDRTGGTPGKRNSVLSFNPDLSFYGLINVFPVNSKTISVGLSEPVPSFEDHPEWLNIEGAGISSVKASDPLFRDYTITIDADMSASQVYEILLDDNMTDFAGNRATKPAFRFGLTQDPGYHDVLFNELLFNPLPGDPDYIEIYNSSDNIIDLSRLVIVSVNDESGDTSGISPVSDEHRCMLPGSYYAVTTVKEKILQRYLSSDRDYLFEVSSLPSMPDNKGHLILLSRELDLIDEVFYTDNMHNSLLTGDEGVSIEKISPGAPSGIASNWHSAAGSSGWGTPGISNSVLAEIPLTGDEISLSSTLITPDGDGTDDFLVVAFKMSGSDNIISMEVFDEAGDHIKRIAGNVLAGSEAVLTWDGTADDGSNVRNGIYILLVTIYNEYGKTERYKKVCSVIRR